MSIKIYIFDLNSAIKIMGKKFLLLLVTILVFSVTKTSSQEGLPIYSDYLTDNYYLLYPSMAGVSNCTKSSISSLTIKLNQ